MEMDSLLSISPIFYNLVAGGGGGIFCVSQGSDPSGGHNFCVSQCSDSSSGHMFCVSLFVTLIFIISVISFNNADKFAITFENAIE